MRKLAVLALLITPLAGCWLESEPGPNRRDECRKRGGMVQENQFGDYAGCVLP
jgi:hypothetical protein